MSPLQYSCLENPMDRGAWKAAVHGVTKSWTWLSDFTFPFHFHALEKEMATHSSVLAWRIPGMGAWWAAVYGVAQSLTRLKWLSMHACIGEGNGSPLQYSCLENPRDGGAWWAVVYGVAQSQTQLKWPAAKSLQSCLTLDNPIDRSPPGSHPWDSQGKNAGVAAAVKAMVFPVVMYGCESKTIKKSWAPKNWCFELWCWRSLESPLDCKEIQPVHPKGNQS